MGGRVAVAAAVAFALLALAPVLAEGRVGRLDPTFGKDGRVATPLGSSASAHLLAGPDGSTVLYRERTLVRLLPDGKVDRGFGRDGWVVLGEEIEGFEFKARSLRMDSQGRVLVFGVASDPSRSFVEPLRLEAADASFAVVMRLKANGGLDPSFGDGRGFFRGDLGLRSDLETDFPIVSAPGGDVDFLDRPVFVASVAGYSGPCSYGKGGITGRARAVARLTANGDLDPTFGGGDGISVLPGVSWSPNLRLDGAGGPVVGVSTETCGGQQIYRFGPDGAPVGNFGASGGRFYRNVSLAEVEPGGGLVLEGGRPWEGVTLLVKATSDGRLAKAFGGDGRVRVKLARGAEPTILPVAVDSRGRVILVGTFELPAAKKRTHSKHRSKPRKRTGRRGYLLITRLLRDGRVDKRFGNRGQIITRFNRPRRISVSSSALDPRGRLLVAVGSFSGGQPPGTHLVVARYLLDR